MQKLASWIQRKMSLLDTMMGFYFACILFGFFATSSRRTQSARFWIVLLLIMTLGAERYMYSYLNTLDNFTPELIQEYVWYLRRMGALLEVIIIFCTADLWDPQIVLQNILTDVQNRLDAIRMLGHLE